MRVVADSHTIFWFTTGSPLLSGGAKIALDEAESAEGIVVSVATLIGLWYVTQTTQAVTAEALERLDRRMQALSTVDLHPVDEAVAKAYMSIARSMMRDPWDRFIVATARTLNLALVTRDDMIRESGLIETIW